MDQPAVCRAVEGVALDVACEQRRQLVGQVDDVLRAVLGRLDLDLPVTGPLYLPRDGELAAQEVDVGDLDRRGLAESQTGERAQRDEGSE